LMLSLHAKRQVMVIGDKRHYAAARRSNGNFPQRKMPTGLSCLTISVCAKLAI
jgi:hypothetical protein